MANSNKKPMSKGGHRKYRQKLDLSNAVIAGDSRLPQVVYCYRFPSRPERLKIGYSSRGLTRVVEQSTSFPEKPEVIFVIHDRRAKVIESAFHEALAHRQSDVLGTEWFDANWKDLLSVSPILRKAAGKSSFRRLAGIAVYAGLVCVSLALYAPLSVSQIGLAQGVPVASIGSVWSSWLATLARFDVGSTFGMFKGMVEASWKFPMFWGFKVIPLAVSLTPLLLPKLLRRRQAF